MPAFGSQIRVSPSGQTLLAIPARQEGMVAALMPIAKPLELGIVGAERAPLHLSGSSSPARPCAAAGASNESQNAALASSPQPGKPGMTMVSPPLPLPLLLLPLPPGAVPAEPALGLTAVPPEPASPGRVALPALLVAPPVAVPAPALAAGPSSPDDPHRSRPSDRMKSPQ